MKVIFLQDVPRVGKRHDIKEVNDGYATNFLLPRKLVIVATPSAIRNLETKQNEIKIERQVREDLLLKNLSSIKGKSITLKVKADDKGHLFKAIHPSDIVKKMQDEHKAQIDEKFIVLEKSIKQVGEFEIQISINRKNSSFQLIVEKE